MLIPVLMSKLPDEFKLILSRIKDRDQKNVLKGFNEELEARERVLLAQAETRSETRYENEKQYTRISLYSGAEKNKRKRDSYQTVCFLQSKTQRAILRNHFQNKSKKKDVVFQIF